MLGTFEAAPQGRKRDFHVIAEQRRGIEPQAGKDAAFEQALGIGRYLVILAFAQFPPDQAVLTSNPGQVFTDPLRR